MNMSTTIKKSFLFLILFSLLLPGTQLLFDFLPHTILHGIAVDRAFPTFSMKAFKDEKFQKKATNVLMKGNTLWPWMLKLNNQIFYSLFNQISASSNGSILCAKDGSFFQPMYLTSFNRVKKYSHKKLGGVPANVKKLQDILAAKGVPLIVLVSPNRIALEPELVPIGNIDPTRLSRQNSYDALRDEFFSRGVNIVDMFSYFQNQSTPGYIDINGEKTKLPVFLPTASHWNEVAACLAVNEVTTKINQVKGSNLRLTNCGHFELSNPPPNADLDLLQIANLLLPKRNIVAGPSVKHELEPIDTAKRKPRILLIGTSFLFAIQKHLEKSGLVEEAPLFFYYRQQRNKSSERFRKLRKKDKYWEEYIPGFDAIILETNQASLARAGIGFVERALKHYEKNAVVQK